MDLLFRLSKKVDDFRDVEEARHFFSRKIYSECHSHFYHSKRMNVKRLKANDKIYFSYENQIIAVATFLGGIIENPKNDAKFRYGHQLANIIIINSDAVLDKKIVKTRTIYISNSELRSEINRVVSRSPQVTFVADGNDAEFQESFENIYLGKISEEKPRKPTAPVTSYGRKLYKRDAKCAAVALMNANYQCEINPDHQTFVSSFTNKHFTEAHHLIPLSCYELFPKNDLDTESNIVSLCPNCHRKIHMGEMSVKKDMLKRLFEPRVERYEKLKIEVDLDRLTEIYMPNSRNLDDVC